MKKQKGWWLVSLVIILALGLSACGGFNTAQPQMVYPTVVIVQYVTQVVATVTPAPPVTPEPPQPAADDPGQTVFINNGSYNPYTAPIYYPLLGCKVASRLHVGDVAFVANNAVISALHMSQEVGTSPIKRKLVSGELLNIIDGPYCQRDALVWEVSDSENEKGFVAEGDGNSYWLLPFGQEVAADQMKPAPYVRLPVAFKQPYGCRPPR